MLICVFVCHAVVFFGHSLPITLCWDGMEGGEASSVLDVGF